MAASEPAPVAKLAPLVVTDEGREWSPFVPLLLVGSEDTGGSFEVYEIAQRKVEQGRSGPPPHVHEMHEEAFYVLEGQLTFSLDGSDVAAAAGTLVVVPRRTVHSFRMDAESRALVFAIPGGLAGFFRELAAARAAGGDDAEARAFLGEKYDSHPIR